MRHVGRIRIGLALVALGHCASAFADYNAGAQAYAKGQFDIALREFQELAELGHAQAQYNLAIMHIRGEGTPKSTGLAYAWMKIAAESGFLPAQDQMKEWVGLESLDDLKTAKELTRQFGFAAIAKRILPDVVCKPAAIPSTQTPPRTIKLKPPRYGRKAMEEDQAGWTVSLVYIAADGRARDVRIIEALPRGVFEKNVVKALMEGQYEPSTLDGKPLGAWVRYGASFAPLAGEQMQDALQAHLAKLSPQVDAGEPVAQYVTAIILLHGGGEPEDAGRARELIERAARSGLADAQGYLGLNLCSCADPEPRQLRWIHQAAVGGVATAQLWLAQQLFQGDRDGTVRVQPAMSWLEQAAASRNPPAMRYMANALVQPLTKDAARAGAISEELAREFDYDPIAHELRAYAYAAMGDFRKAVGAQEEAILHAQKRKWSLEPLEKALDDYRNGRQRAQSPLSAY